VSNTCIEQISLCKRNC